MELRRDPITQSWVILEDGQIEWPEDGPCPLCHGQESRSPLTIYEYPYHAAEWQVRVIPHLRPVYHIEGNPERRAEGIYDKMRNLGAHEIVIETPKHSLPLRDMSDEQTAQVLRALVARITDLKRDKRFRYISVFRNQGKLAGQELEHPHTEITATPFIPRRVGYELRSALRYYALKERCLICDMLQQELRQQVRTIEWDDMFLAFCPFASRVPFETWLLPVNHHCSFEEDVTTWDKQLHLARFIKSVLRRLITVATPTYHMVLHTSPNVGAKYERSGNWQTLADDYHWHIEILPVLPAKSKSYGLKEVYYNSMLPEDAALALRNAPVEQPATT